MHADTIDSMDPAAKAGLGPTILGGIIGAAVGIIVHMIIETGGGMRWQSLEAPWFAIAIGLLTGIGVRQANNRHMGRSYLRGAVSGIIALAAIVLSTLLISKVMQRYDAVSKTTAAAATAANAETAKGGTANEPAAAATTDAGSTAPVDPEAAPPAASPPAGGGGVGRMRQDKLNPWQFLFMAVGVLAAYELGRGVDHTRREVALEPGEPMTRGTDPSN